MQRERVSRVGAHDDGNPCVADRPEIGRCHLGVDREARLSLRASLLIRRLHAEACREGDVGESLGIHAPVGIVHLGRSSRLRGLRKAPVSVHHGQSGAIERPVLPGQPEELLIDGDISHTVDQHPGAGLQCGLGLPQPRGMHDEGKLQTPRLRTRHTHQPRHLVEISLRVRYEPHLDGVGMKSLVIPR